MNERQQNSAIYPIPFLMVDAADGKTAKTGLTPVVTISKNGGGFGAAAGSVGELSSGWYSWAADATDRDTLGELAIHITGVGADPLDFKYTIIPQNPFATETAADVVKVSGDEAAANNLEAMLDGTGGVTLSLGRIVIVNASSDPAIQITSTGIAIDIQSADNYGVRITGGTVGVYIVGGEHGIAATDFSGNLVGNVAGKVLGDGTTQILGIGVWAAGAAGASLPTSVPSASSIADQVDVVLSLAHSSGSWAGGGATPEEIDELLSETHGSGSWAGTAQVSVVLDPAIGTIDSGSLPTSLSLEAFEEASKAFAIGVEDAENEPVDLSGMTLRFVVQTLGNNPTGVLQVDEITVSGDYNEVANFTLSTVGVTPGTYAWRLWSVSSEADVVLLHGTIKVLAAMPEVS